MNPLVLKPLVWALILSMPAVLLLSLLIPGKVVHKHRLAFASFIQACCMVNAIILGSVSLFVAPFVNSSVLSNGPSFTLDVMARTYGMLTALLAVAVSGFSRRYMRADERSGRFMQLIGAAIGCVSMLPLSASLPMFLAAWIAAGLVLHPLLTFNRLSSSGAAAAWQKFIVSRLGDVCLFAAMYLFEHRLASVEFKSMHMAAIHTSSAALQLPCVLMVLGACFKSAQFPFFSWLPDTLDAPTPVSALMHAGIVNAGGLLLLRTSGMVSMCTAASCVALTAGVLTMCVAAMALPCQVSVKRSLAYSTVLQMGFMMAEIGLGAYGAAGLHLAAHAIYKAHAFLRSSTVKPACNPTVNPTPSQSVPGYAVASATAVAVSALLLPITGHTLAEWCLQIVLISAIGGGLARRWEGAVTPGSVLNGVGVTAALCAMYHLLCGMFASMVVMPVNHHPILFSTLAALLIVAGLAMGAMAPLARRLTARISPAFITMAQSGFYIGNCFNALLMRREPVHQPHYSTSDSTLTRNGELYA